MSENKKVDDYINEYFNKKSSTLETSDLFRMIEEAMSGVKVQAQKHQKVIEEQAPEVLSEEQKLDVKKFMSTALAAYQVPSEQAGKFGTKERKDFQFHVTRQIKGKTLEQKIESINKFISGTELDPNAKISTILSHCGTLSILSRLVEDYNASAAGFAFEAFIAALLKGEQIADPVGGSLPIEDAVIYMDSPKTGAAGTPISLKLLNTKTTIEGSIENLLTFLGKTKAETPVGGFPYIEYIVAIKHSDKYLGFNSFIISTDNFFDWIKPAYFDFKKISIPIAEAEDAEQSLEASPKEVKKLEAIVDEWKKETSYFFKYWGFEESSNPESLDYSKFIPSPLARNIDAVKKAIELAISNEKTFRSSTIFKEAEDLWFTNDEISKFKNNTATSEDLSIMMAKMRTRRGYYVEAVRRYNQNHPLNPYYINRLNRIKSGKPEKKKSTRSVGKKMDYLNSLLSEKKYKEWSDVLRAAKSKDQFSIPNEEVRGGKRLDAASHGALIIDSKNVEKILEIYSEKLLDLCAPIYEALGALTDNINGFFLGTTTLQKSKAAFGASSNAKELSTQTERLAQENTQEG